MKRLKAVLSFALILCLLCALSAPAFAETQYNVRIYAGNYGTIDGKSMLPDKVNYKGHVSFTASDRVQLKDEKYFVKGVRLAGRDNNDMVYTTGFDVTGDVDYVVAYGIRGNMLTYYIEYRSAETGELLTPDDGTGGALPSRETRYCNVGDELYITYRQVVGYAVSNTYNFHRTMREADDGRVFTFYYLPETETAPAPAAPEDVVTDQAPNVVIPPDAAPAGGPQEVIDLDEDDTPLGLLDLGKDAVENGAQLLNALPFGARVGLIGLDLVVIGLIIWAIIYARKRKKEQKEENA